MQTHKHSEPLLIGVLPFRGSGYVAALDDDICINRHNANDASLDANTKVDKKYWRDRVMEIARERPVYLHLVCRLLKKNPNEISPRLSELKERGLLKPNGERRENCAVLIEVKG